MTWQENFDTNFNKTTCNTQNQFTTSTLSAFETCFWHLRITCYILKFLMQTHKFNETRINEFETNNSQFVKYHRISYIIVLSLILVSKEKSVYFITTCCNFVLVTTLFLVQASSSIHVEKEISLRNSVKICEQAQTCFAFTKHLLISAYFNLVG